jgi:NAD(P)-dependent dehydrogenase (short-subunit alcohol dehydrogenase family)
MSFLPSDVLDLIFSHLNNKEIKNINIVCVNFHNIINIKKNNFDVKKRLNYLNKINDSLDDLITITNVKNSVHEMCEYYDEYVYKLLFDDLLINNNNLIIAGGFVLGMMNSINDTFDKSNYLNSDIDLFFVGNSTEKNVRDLLCKLNNAYKFMVIETSNVITLLPHDSKYRKIQLIRDNKKDIHDLFLFFDLPCVRFAFDGTSIYTYQQSLNALKSKCNIIDRNFLDVDKRCSVHLLRVNKYYKKGYFTIVSNYSLYNTQYSILIPSNDKKIYTILLNSNIKDIINIINDVKQQKDKNMIFYQELDNNLKKLICHFYKNKITINSSYHDIDVDLTNEINAYEFIHDVRECNSFKLDENDFTYNNLLLKMKNREYFNQNNYLINKLENFIEINYQNILKINQNAMYLYNRYKLRKCYMCNLYCYDNSENKKKLKMCNKCNMYNNDKVFNNTLLLKDLSDVVLNGKIAIIIGGRTKIGFQIGVSLIKHGYNVICTSRFVNIAINNYSKYFNLSKEQLLERISFFPLDLSLHKNIIEFVNWVKSKYNNIHLLINNAAQTIKYSKLHYANYCYQDFTKKITIDNSENYKFHYNNVREIPIDRFNVLNKISELTYERPPLKKPPLNKIKDENKLNNVSLIDNITKNIYENLTEYTIEKILDLSKNREFKYLRFDDFGEVIKISDWENSWNKPFCKIDPKEIIETQNINCNAPIILIQLLTNLLTPIDNNLTHIINVTSHEGVFSNWKSSKHVHNNASKAGLNMFTRTMAYEYANMGILMNLADPGWVSSGVYTNKEPPLTPVDGAARILEPLFNKKYGKLYVNYKIANTW